MRTYLQINPKDNVAVALAPLSSGTSIELDGITLTLSEDIPQGHKFALNGIPEGGQIIKYGCPIGIAKEDLPYVFDRFYKVDKAHSGMGSGLGLSIARELLKWMGEDIWVKSEVGKGTQFGFTLRRDPTP